jgi:hypothetical protein
MNDKKDNQYRELIDAVEQRAGMEMHKSQDFDWLAARIETQTHQVVSANTLKRLWGYFENVHVNTRTSVLDLLSQYLGYKSYTMFIQSRQAEKANKSSDSVKTRHLETKDLETGFKLLITWHPDRKMMAEHLGNGHFIIREIENSKLCVGDTFDCHLVIEGEPLFLGNLSHEGMPPLAYQAGKMGGIHFEILVD